MNDVLTWQMIGVLDQRELGRVPPSGFSFLAVLQRFPFIALQDGSGRVKHHSQLAIPPGRRKEMEGLRRFTEVGTVRACCLSIGRPIR